VRFSAQLGFKIENVTREAIKKQAHLLGAISQERIRDEFSKLLMTSWAAGGVRELLELGLLKYIVPELIEGVGMEQNLHHIYSVFEHNVRALDYTVGKNYSFEVRLASLLHDVGKSRTKMGIGKYATFYNHEVVGARMTVKILERLRFSKETIEYVTHLVRQHLFYYNVGEVSEAGVRRFLVRVGPDNIDDLLKVREADRIGSGVPKAVPYKLRHLLFMIEKVKRDPISPKMLAVNGDILINDLKMKPSSRMGGILGALLEEVLDDPQKNNKELLLIRAQELDKLTDKELFDLRKKSENRKEEFESGVEDDMKKKFAVK
jgi:poly(A) polymerase/tRNA nucleotidyltransferase (CCA-adding enzyme)